MKNQRTKYIAQAGVIAAVYSAASLITMFLLQGLAWGPIQFRVSEALVVLALMTPAAIPGLTFGCVIVNVCALFINGTGVLGLFDVVFGSTATLLGALWCWHFHDRVKLSLFGPVLTNALIVPAYLPILLQGLGFYTIPFTDIALDNMYIGMYLFGVIALGIGEAVVVYGLGYPLYKALKKNRVFQGV